MIQLTFISLIIIICLIYYFKIFQHLDYWENNEFPPKLSYNEENYIKAILALGINLTLTDKESYGKKNLEIRKYLKKQFPDRINVHEDFIEALGSKVSTQSVCFWLKQHFGKFDELELVLFYVRLISIDGIVTNKEQEEIDYIARHLEVESIEYQQYIDYVNKSYYSRESNTYTNSRTSINAALIYFGFDKTPSIKELKEKFRQKVKSCHPDLFSTASEAEKKILESKFNELQKYYNEILVEIG
ncbi:MAG: hypothetical protein ACK479_07870 [Fluviicola sp.]